MEPHQTGQNSRRPLKVAWITYFPIEWLSDLPPGLKDLPRQHPATWQRVLWEEFQKREDMELHVIVLRNHFPESMRFRRGNTTFHCVKTPAGMRGPSLFWLDTVLVKRELKEIEPDVVHAWGSESGGAAVAGRLGYPTLVTMQGILTWLASVFPLNNYQKFLRALEPGSLKRAHVATCESSFAMRYLRERYPHLKLLQVEHAPNRIFSEVGREVQERPKRFLCVGGFTRAKGADVVLEALNGLVEAVEFELVWIGARDAELEEEMRGRTKEELWRRVIFRQDVPSTEIAQELSRATLLLHGARADNSPNSVKEAVVAGVPVVATDTGGIPDYVHAGRNGFLFQSGNAEDCGAKIQQALAHALFGRGLVDGETLEEVRRYLSAERMAEKFLEAYEVTLQCDPRAKR